MAKQWTRWQDWVALVVGVLVALSPLVVSTAGEPGALTTLIVLGVLLAVTSLWSLYSPGMVATEYVHAVLGVLLFLAPFVFTYVALSGAAWTSWIAGIVAVVVGLWAVPVSTKAHKELAQH
jgi:uncharacterized membrane protein HdeD (DUF308 family)